MAVDKKKPTITSASARRKKPPTSTSATPKKATHEQPGKKSSLPPPPPPPPFRPSEAPPAAAAVTTTAKHAHKTIEEYKANMRQWHNQIGKKYRHKLNEQFECLQAVLKAEESEEGGKHAQGHGGRTINKAKVLDMARARIEALTTEREALMEERRMLVDGLKEKEKLVRAV
ncbi:hypothetical protein OQA88_7996 [Cercophora sp. LCS_1]